MVWWALAAKAASSKAKSNKKDKKAEQEALAAELEEAQQKRESDRILAEAQAMRDMKEGQAKAPFGFSDSYRTATQDDVLSRREQTLEEYMQARQEGMRVDQKDGSIQTSAMEPSWDTDPYGGASFQDSPEYRSNEAVRELTGIAPRERSSRDQEYARRASEVPRMERLVDDYKLRAEEHYKDQQLREAQAEAMARQRYQQVEELKVEAKYLGFELVPDEDER